MFQFLTKCILSNLSHQMIENSHVCSFCSCAARKLSEITMGVTLPPISALLRSVDPWCWGRGTYEYTWNLSRSALPGTSLSAVLLLVCLLKSCWLVEKRNICKVCACIDLRSSNPWTTMQHPNRKTGDLLGK